MKKKKDTNLVIGSRPDNYHWFLKAEKPYENYAFIDKFFTEEECDKIISYGLDDAFAKKDIARVGSDTESNYTVDNTIRKSQISWIKSLQETEWLFRKLTDGINHVNEKYFEYDLKAIESLQFTIYSEKDNDFYGKHIDSMRIFSFEAMRKLSFSIQLSTPESYSGGELALFLDHRTEVLSKNKGTMLFFPSYTLHEVKPVTKGTRYSLVGWVTGPKFR